MSARLDPRIKQQIKFALERAMYAATERRFANKLRDIITQNSTKAGFSHQSFSYKGTYYSFELVAPRYKNQRLMSELHASMDAYLTERTHIALTEKPYIIGFFTKMLNTSNSVLDYYALLPDCMHRPLTQLNLPPECVYPRELSDEQVATFRINHSDWILMLKKRMVLDLVMT